MSAPQAAEPAQFRTYLALSRSWPFGDADFLDLGCTFSAVSAPNFASNLLLHIFAVFFEIYKIIQDHT